jgi:hypothetical protein
MLSAERSAVSIARALPRRPQQVGARRDALAVLGEPLDLDLRVERAEEGLGDRQPGDDDRLAAVHHPGEARVGGDHRRGRDVAALAQILGQGGSRRRSSRSKPGIIPAHQLPLQIGHQQGRALGVLGIVGADRMAAFQIFVEVEAVAIFLEPGRHLAGVAGMDPVVLGRAVEEDRRVADALAQILVGRILRHEGPVRRLVGIAIFVDPRGAGEQVRIALHVEQRRADDHRRIEIGPLVHRRADQHAAVGAAGNADLALGGDSGADQILGDGVEIVEAASAGSRAAPPRAIRAHIRRRRGCWRGHRHCPPRPRTGRAGRRDRAGR